MAQASLMFAVQIELATAGSFMLPSAGSSTGSSQTGAALWGMLRVAAAELPSIAFCARDNSAARPRSGQHAPFGWDASVSLHGSSDHARVEHRSRLLRVLAPVERPGINSNVQVVLPHPVLRGIESCI